MEGLDLRIIGVKLVLESLSVILIALSALISTDLAQKMERKEFSLFCNAVSADNTFKLELNFILNTFLSIRS
jgi:hypothetical protein